MLRLLVTLASHHWAARLLKVMCSLLRHIVEMCVCVCFKQDAVEICDTQVTERFVFLVSDLSVTSAEMIKKSILNFCSH